MTIETLRSAYHRCVCAQILGGKEAPKFKMVVPSVADVDNASSVHIAHQWVAHLGHPTGASSPTGQTAGRLFGEYTMVFLRDAFSLLHHLRPVMWRFSASQDPLGIASFDQYEHLALLEKQLAQNAELAAAWGGGYLVTPDITVSRESCGDEEINAYQPVVDEGESVARLTPLRRANRASPRPMLQASISRKWTIRSDRSQNTRTEALNLIRSRKGHTPHIVAVTAEPLPTRIASLALGTGDIDCVYHMALPELELAIADCENADQGDMLRTMVQGRRLRDISDLPFDLAI